MNTPLPPIPAKRYFTIGEVAELCDVKPHVLRYWEQEFTQLRPMKRRGNRRYYQHHEVLMIRRIRELLYGQGFTISGARTRLQSWSPNETNHNGLTTQESTAQQTTTPENASQPSDAVSNLSDSTPQTTVFSGHLQPKSDVVSAGLDLKKELMEIRDFLAQGIQKYSL
ncbi:MerR family transcriptional regulator [Lampropedia puyangensis]|uniref:MerR family transcriptional regulator n=1 Tax=Lampropedia puyangensis TaxID=1330072 RepID=A0A4S8F864_9BURK|nr:MerR family transcriptional regulator [Lampropedia puyangensis]THU02845.1 MerR family transcriptional regulator [Lampropedia puyangensis]